MANRNEEVLAGILATGADPKRIRGQVRYLIEHPPDRRVVTGSDHCEERKQRIVAGLLGTATCLGHG